MKNSFVILLVYSLGVFYLKSPRSESIKSPNIALKKPASQSSTKPGRTAEIAVDGNAGKRVSASETSPTLSDSWHWWMVDLLSIYNIQSIRLSRLLSTDCYGHCYHGLSVEVSETNPFTLPGFPGLTNAAICLKILHFFNDPITYACERVLTGRYIRLVKYIKNVGYHMILGEVEVYTFRAQNLTEHLPPLNNIARGKLTYESSYYNKDLGSQSYKAVDGNLNGLYYAGSCSHTNDGDREWWLVDLQGLFLISSVRIANRVDCCQYKLSNFTIEISVIEPSDSFGFPGNSDVTVCHKQIDPVPYDTPATYECGYPVIGRYVRVVKSGTLTICEFEVFGQAFYISSNWIFELIGGENVVYLTPATVHRSEMNCVRQLMTHNENNLNNMFMYAIIDANTNRCSFRRTAPVQLSGEIGFRMVAAKISL